MGAKQTLLMERVLDETRLAVIEDGELCELYCQRPDAENLTGNIYLGRVENVLPGMNAAFVDIGMDKNGFLAAGDIAVDARGERGLAEALGKARIEQLARPGQQMLVQAIKSQPGAKGPRLSSHVTLPGRRMVLLPGVRYVGVSKKISDPAERGRLHEIGEALMEDAGLILRTAAQGAPGEALQSEYQRLRGLYDSLKARAEHAVAPKLLHDDNGLALRAARDMLREDVDALWVDGESCLEEVMDCVGALAPEYLGRVRPHEGSTPLFDLYRVDRQADKALQKFVWLKSGGSLVIEETEALTVVDVNTGKNVGRRSAEDTLFETNCEAARELMRQLRLRDIGGIIVADFIDMKGRERQEALLEALRACAARDRNSPRVVDITPLGLVELTRKKVRQSLSRQLLHTCSHCGGNGTVLSYETAARRIAREIWRRRRGGDGSPLLVEAPPEVCGWLRKLGNPCPEEARALADAALEAGEYRVSPLDASRLPDGAKKLPYNP